MESTADQGEHRSVEQSVDSPDPVCEPSTCEAAHDSSEVVNGDDATLVSGVCDLPIWGSDSYFGDIVGRGVDASHDTLVIALEEDGYERECLNGNVK